MRIGDVASPVDGKTDNQDGTQITWNDFMPDTPKSLTAQDNPQEEEWKTSFSPNKAFIKNHKGSAVQSIEPVIQPQRDSFLQKSSNWKDFVDATSPIVSSFLPKNKEANPSTDIDVLDAAVRKLTTDAENLTSSKEPDRSRGKVKTNENGLILAKQTAKSKMLAEINKRRRARTEEEKKVTKQSKDDLNRSTKTSCSICGVPMADGPRNICKSCMNRQMRDKSREKNQGREVRTGLKSPSHSFKKEESENSIPDPQSKDIRTAESPVKGEKSQEENPTRNRSMSLDTVDTACETNKKFGPQKRTNTDLGPKSIFNKSTQENGMHDVNQLPQSNSSTKKTGSASNLSEMNPSTHMKQENGLRLMPLDYSKTTHPELPGISGRVMKRSTTDSEIVSKSKLINKPITSKEEQKAALVNSASRQQGIDDFKKRSSPKSENRETLSSHLRHSSQENVNMGMKLERSKTVMGKMNVDGDKKNVLELDRTRKKEGSNVSTESEKSYSNKKFTNSGRSHTIIGDGHNKRQKNKGDWTKPKAGKRENSACSIMKDIKKKLEKKGSPSEEDGKRVSFVEGETIKRMENEEAMLSRINNTFPQNLYDYKQEDGDESSDSELDTDTTQTQKNSTSNPPPTTEIPDAILSRGIPRKTPRSESRSMEGQAKYLGSNSHVENPGSSNRYGNASSGGSTYDTIRSGMVAEPNSTFHVPRWSEEGAMAIEYEEMLEDEDQDTEYEEGDFKDSYSECSSSERPYMALDKIEEQSDEEISEAESEEDLYTSYPSKSDESGHQSEEQNNEPEYAKELEPPVTYNDSYLEQNKELYTMSQIARSNSGGETYYELDKKASSTQAEYTETSYTGHWTQAMVGNGDSAQNYFNSYETDVDTGLSVLHPQNEKGKQYTEPEPGKEWGLAINEDGDSSSSSDDEDDQVKCSDSWYTGGYFDNSKSDTSTSNDDLVYFNDRAAKKWSDSDIYTGELFSNVVTKGNDQTDMSKNNNITLDDNLFEGSNFWNISSRPQMHQLSRTETMENIDEMYPDRIEDLCGNSLMIEDSTWLISNVSNNNDTEDENKPSTSGFKAKFPVQIASKSDYTEYTPELLASVRARKPKNDLILLGNKDFSKYDRPQREERVREEIISIRNCDSFKTDTLFFGDEPPRIAKPQRAKSPVEHSGLYFNKNFKPVMRLDHSPENIRCHYPKDDDYQGGFFYATRYESNNNNNTDPDCDSYTGCFRNEEEYKPTHDGLFNDKASSFVYQKRAPEPAPLYFCNATSKSYYDTEESVYAFEKKKEPKAKPIEMPKILKVGSIVVRNNVECEVDYAQNIDMDSQDVPKTWMRYDYGADANVADTSSYAQNVSFEDFGGAKPWVIEGCRAPWKLTKEKKGKDEAGNKNGNGSWKAAPDKMVRSVKTLGSYMTKWF